MYAPEGRFAVPERPVYGNYPIYQPVSHFSHPPFNPAVQYLQPTPFVPNPNAHFPLRRKRASKPKVRTGCTTCKIRRIKCDETKPSCKRCTSTGRKCDGYEFSKEDIENATSDLIEAPPKPFATLTDLFLPSSISRLPFEGTAQERRIFHRFEVRTIPSLVGGSESAFWRDIVLKIGCEEPVIRNAIIALGTLHEDYQQRDGKYSNDLIKEPSHQHALHLYGTALRQLNKQLNEGNKPQAKLAIISSILFSCFEVLRRNNMAAVIHYQAGMRELMRQMNVAQKEAEASPPKTSLPSKFNRSSKGPVLQSIPSEDLDIMLRVFARYDIQACTFSPKRAERINTTHALNSQPPTSFTLTEVRNHLDNLLISVYQLAKSDLAMYRYWPTASVPWEWRLRRDEGIDTFEAWQSAIENFFSTAESRLSPSDFRSLLGMRMQIKVALMMLKTCIDSGPECTFDQFYSDFLDIVTRIENMTLKLQFPEAKPLENETTSFTMDLGIIHPLFFVALKCRDYVLRRRAITQLRKSGREGVWEGPIMAVLAERLVEMEEGSIDDKGRVIEGAAVDKRRVVPEERRWHSVQKNVDYETGRVLFEAKRAKDRTWTSWETVRGAVVF